MISGKKLFISALLCAGISLSAHADEQLTLKIGTEPSFAPFEFKDPDSSEIIGFDIDIMNAIAKESNFKVDWVQLPFDGILPAVITGSLDAAISAFVMNEERIKRVDFSEPYYTVGQGIMIRKDTKAHIKGSSDLEGKILCVQIGSVGADVARKVKDADVKSFNTTSEAYIALDRKGCDAMISAVSVHEYYLSQTNNKNFMMVPEIIDAANVGIVIPKGNQKIKNLINNGFRKIKNNGTYKTIYSKWFSSGN
ncbi:MAG TPA: basic amino acid ABC transporter substrate-binding protein [Succinivibrionaceae bacterium]|nr:basic amino acid ABC transporter substrate-binding protein [Succinivibrionaceae bacterium]